MGWSKRKAAEKGRRLRNRDDRIRLASLKLRTAAELDQFLDADPQISSNPVLRAAVRGHIQKLSPHLRDM